VKYWHKEKIRVVFMVKFAPAKQIPPVLIDAN
jgi:hypothetical protein